MDTFHKYDGLSWAIEEHSKLKEYDRTTQTAPTSAADVENTVLSIVCFSHLVHIVINRCSGAGQLPVVSAVRRREFQTYAIHTEQSCAAIDSTTCVRICFGTFFCKREAREGTAIGHRMAN